MEAFIIDKNIILAIELIFQSGEFYAEEGSFWKDFVIQSLSILTALVVFWLGVEANKRAKKTEHNELMKQKYDYFVAIINSIIGLTKEQSTLWSNFVQQLEADITNIPTPISVPIKDLERFSDVHDHESYYHAYLHKHISSGDAVESFRAFYTTIDFLYLSNNKLFERAYEARKFDHERKVKYSNIFKKVADEAAELVRKNSLAEEKDEFVEFLNQSLMSFYEKRVDPTSIKEIQALFLLPVLNKIVKEYRSIDSAVQLAIDLKQANQIYESVVANNNSVLRWLQTALGRFDERVLILERLPK